MEEKTRYSTEELKEFEEIIQKKIDMTRRELDVLKKSISKRDDEGTESTTGISKSLEDGTDSAERESLNQLASRQMKFLGDLEKAMVRIKNGTYGICSVTGKLISKERLRAVPHTTQSIEAKLQQRG